jgi:hypothetical protein
VQVLSTVAPELAGGYWDLDNVRLVSTKGPALANPRVGPEGFEFTVESEPGLRFEILSAADAALPVSAWTVAGTVTNATGAAVFVDAQGGTGTRYYQARQVP